MIHAWIRHHLSSFEQTLDLAIKATRALGRAEDIKFNRLHEILQESPRYQTAKNERQTLHGNDLGHIEHLINTSRNLRSQKDASYSSQFKSGVLWTQSGIDRFLPGSRPSPLQLDQDDLDPLSRFLWVRLESTSEQLVLDL